MSATGLVTSAPGESVMSAPGSQWHVVCSEGPACLLPGNQQYLLREPGRRSQLGEVMCWLQRTSPTELSENATAASDNDSVSHSSSTSISRSYGTKISVVHHKTQPSLRSSFQTTDVPLANKPFTYLTLSVRRINGGCG
jgi:hypothetical protein